ncbi:MAG: hypothetical protein IJI62_05605 [Lachnospiraceae bacterium]|nr:hypothetical protein [Lachnospiraceae bacterium]
MSQEVSTLRKAGAALHGILKRISGPALWAGLAIELLIMVIEKSSLVNPYEGLLFRLTFCLFSVKVLELLCAGRFRKKELAVYAALLVLGVISWRCSGRNQLLRFMMFILAVYREENRKVLKAFLFSMISGTALLAVLSVLGVLGTVTETANFDGAVSTRFCFGMGNPNSFQIMVGAIVLLTMILYGQTCRKFWFAVLLALDVLLYVLCRSLMGTGLIALPVLWTFLLRIRSEQRGPQGAADLNRRICTVMKAVFVLGFLFCIAGAIWGSTNPLINWIDYHLMSGRIASIWDFTFHDGTLSTWTLFGSRLNTRFFDLGWIRVIYWYGVIPALVILWMTGRLEAAMEKKGDLYGCMAVIVVCLFTLTEAHFVSEYIGRNFLFVMTAPYLPAIFGTEAVKEEKA